MSTVSLGFLAIASVSRADEARPHAPFESVVTATKGATSAEGAPAAVTVVDRDQLEASADKTLDDQLRGVSSFGVFRRSSSLVADPSSQGFSLRGIGPSGVSRALMLVDGVPETDPFGGWVYWRSIPTLTIDRIEVVPGGGSALYGNYALGGVVQVITRDLRRPAIDADAEIGSQNTAHVAARAGASGRTVAASIDGEYFRSDGYPTVSPTMRGPVDHNADSDHANAGARVAIRINRDLNIRLSGSFFRERESGGTDFSTATVQLARYSLGATWTPTPVGRVDAIVFGHAEEFEQDRPRVDATRTMAALASTQRIPAFDVGDSLVWMVPFNRRRLRNVVSAGEDLRWIDSTAHEELSPQKLTATTTVGRDIAARQLDVGFFIQDALSIAHVVDVVLAVRADYWSNATALRTLHFADGSRTTERLAARDGWAPTSRFGLVVHGRDWLRLRASAYRAFRAPTLNELYRPFQVGTIITAPNSQLIPETLWGGELGIDVDAGGVAFRATGFANALFDPVMNVTLAQPTADGAQRQRQNVGDASVVGAEVTLSWRPARRWRATVDCTYVDAVIHSARAQPDLVGKRLSQSPRHRLSALLMFNERRWFDATLELRYVGFQFDDDRNQLALPGYVVVNARVAREIGAGFGAFIAVDNLLNQQYLTGKSGVDTVGEPLFVWAGLRYRHASN